MLSAKAHALSFSVSWRDLRVEELSSEQASRGAMQAGGMRAAQGVHREQVRAQDPRTVGEQE